MRATGVGSLSGTDFRGALGFVLEVLPDITPWPELPGRGPASGMVGRAAALLVDLPVELTSQGWTLTDHPGRDQRRAVAQWRHDLDDLEELAHETDGVLKVGVCGPWTLAAQLHRPRAEVALADPGARRELGQSLAAGVAGLVAELNRRLRRLRVVVQADEPMLPAVLGGGVATASGYGRLRSVERAEVVEGLRPFADGVLHCCAGTDWLSVASEAGFAGVSVDLTGPDAATLDAVASLLDAGRDVIAGVVDSSAIDVVPGVDAIVSRTLGLIERLRLDPRITDERLVISPGCGVAGWDRTAAARVLRDLARAATLITERLRG